MSGAVRETQPEDATRERSQGISGLKRLEQRRLPVIGTRTEAEVSLEGERMVALSVHSKSNKQMWDAVV